MVIITESDFLQARRELGNRVTLTETINPVASETRGRWGSQPSRSKIGGGANILTPQAPTQGWRRVYFFRQKARL